MEAVIFMGLQAAGKSTFYKERFFTTHLRLNLDMLKTRRRERQLLDSCLGTRTPFVLDNTSPTRSVRQEFISLAKQAKFRVTGYYFQSRIDDCLRRNQQRGAKLQVPNVAILGTYNELQIPTHEEGFDQLYFVKIADDKQYVVEDWRDSV